MTTVERHQKQSLPRWRWKDVTISVIDHLLRNCGKCRVGSAPPRPGQTWRSRWQRVIRRKWRSLARGVPPDRGQVVVDCACAHRIASNRAVRSSKVTISEPGSNPIPGSEHLG